MTLWACLSLVPFTEPHRLYRATRIFIADCEAFTAREAARMEMSPPPRMRRVLRNPVACSLAVEAMIAVLHGFDALARGVDGSTAAAIVNEHWPVHA